MDFRKSYNKQILVSGLPGRLKYWGITFCILSSIVPYSFRLLNGYCARVPDDLVLFMNDHLTNDVPLETPFKPNDPWITNKKDVKLYMLEHLDKIKFPDPNTLPHLSFIMALL